MRYVLGLDLGIASVGWAVLDLEAKKVADLGVRAFDRAEQPKTGAPLAEPRRQARSARRRLRRRRGRLDRIKSLFVDAGMADCVNPALRTAPGKADPWELRADGLDRLLSGEEFARALYHLAKLRGFKSNRKHVRDKSSEDGVIAECTENNRMLMAERGYRTAGEMFHKDDRFAERKRNASGSYTNVVDRALLEDEAHRLFDAQRGHGAPWATAEVEAQYIEFFAFQFPFARGERILETVGQCTFEPDEKRAPRNAYTTERATLLQKVNGLRLSGSRAFFVPEQLASIVARAHEKDILKYSDIRKLLKLPDDVSFVGVQYGRKRGVKDWDTLSEEGKRDKCEDIRVVEMKGFHTLRKVFCKADPVMWDCIRQDRETLDHIAYALTVYKTDDEIRACMEERRVAPAVIDVALQCPTFEKFAHLSLKALASIMPYLEEGKVYSKACELAGYNHSGPRAGERGDKLPVLERGAVRNPVVFRALTQARKVVNAVVARYGAPTYIHIEMTRELGKSMDERNKLKRELDERTKEREDEEGRFMEEFGGHKPTRDELWKHRLYHEQNGQCAYSGRPFELHRLFEPGYAEIDHILPYSRTFDDSWNNKVLVHGAENRLKRNSTPFEYFGDNAARWEHFEAWVKATYGRRHLRKASNLLVENFDEEREGEWKARALGESSYIAREFRQVLETHLIFADPAVKRPIVCFNGRVTAMARGLWGFNKVRSENDLHHAMDAAVLAALTPATLQRITRAVQAGEFWEQEYVDIETGEVVTFTRTGRLKFPDPWPGFRAEVLAALAPPVPEEGEAPARVLVSRMPRRKVGGAFHAETIRSAKRLDEGKSAVRVLLTSLRPAHLDNFVDPEQNVRLYAAIRERLAAYGGDPKKAFGDPANPLHKPSNGGRPGPVVKGVRVMQTQKSGLPVRAGVADNGDMVRIDMFTKGGRFYVVPVYTHHFAAGELPSRAVVAFKPEEEWTVIDDTYAFLFSVYPMDLVRVVTKRGAIFGYYVGCNRSTAGLSLCQPSKRDEIMEGIGVKIATSVEKYEVDLLGNLHPVRKEPRRGLADRGGRREGAPAG